jgi:hypothetical protein
MSLFLSSTLSFNASSFDNAFFVAAVTFSVSKIRSIKLYFATGLFIAFKISFS